MGVIGEERLLSWLLSAFDRDDRMKKVEDGGAWTRDGCHGRWGTISPTGMAECEQGRRARSAFAKRRSQQLVLA